MIVLTGAAGFIASNMLKKLNEENITEIIIVDDFSSELKNRNILNKKYVEKIDRKIFFEWLSKNNKSIELIIHLGARTDTTEKNIEIFNELNLKFSQKIWDFCVEKQIPLIYASSAATYGNGEYGYNDDHEIIEKLKPLNEYGISKNEFDKWVLNQKFTPPYWYGLKFFNVYGPNEYHKGRMASVVFHSYNQILITNKVKLFKSHRLDIKDGEQKRDFIYVKDVVEVISHLMNYKKNSGIYNVGTGKARTFLDLAINTFNAMNKEVNIEFIDTPEDIRANYQYFTEANIQKLLNTGYNKKFTSLEEGIYDYVTNYLKENKYN